MRALDLARFFSVLGQLTVHTTEAQNSTETQSVRTPRRGWCAGFCDAVDCCVSVVSMVKLIRYLFFCPLDVFLLSRVCLNRT